MADKESDDPALGSSQTGADKGNPPRAAEGETQLSSNDQRTLEKAIRRSVSSIVGAGHPELLVPPKSSIVASDAEYMLHPELHPVAKQMPGTERAIAFRPNLMQCLVDPDPRHHRQFIEELQRAGVPMQTLAVHLFAPVATQLGHLWCTDEADFMQVAVASTRLNMIVNHISHTSNPSTGDGRDNRRILLARTRGAMHTIGVSIVASCFRDLGWDVDGGSDLEIDDSLYMKLSLKPYNLLGISVGRIDEVDECSEAIRRVHGNPRTRGTKIAVGGPAVVSSPKTFQRIGVDYVTRSALDVMQLAHAL